MPLSAPMNNSVFATTASMSVTKHHDAGPSIASELIEALAQFTYRLHQNNIYYIDYTLGNILYKKKDGKYHFALVDNDRMDFGPISVEKGIKNLVRWDCLSNIWRGWLKRIHVFEKQMRSLALNACSIIKGVKSKHGI
jgi:hypothetical protein